MGSKNHTCPSHDLSENATEAIFGTITFFQFDKILAGSCVVVACAIIFIHLLSHTNRLSNPSEQVKIMRISLLVPFYSLFCFLSICFPTAYVYLDPWLEVFQANSLCAFFLLMCDFISPDSKKRSEFFAKMTVLDRKPQPGRASGLPWFRSRWIAVFQYPIIALVTAIATDISEAVGTYCQYKIEPYYTRLWITIVSQTSLTIAVTSVLVFVKTLKSELAVHKPMVKLVAFKLIVFLSFVQSIIFLILQSTSSLNPTSKLTYADLHIGIPALLSCIEMVPISAFIAWAYSVQPYLLGRGADTERLSGPTDIPKSYQGGFLGVRAFLAMLNPRETVEGIVFAFSMITELHEPSRSSDFGHDMDYTYHSNSGIMRNNRSRYQALDRENR
ncbi:organic solute transporter Ostalpha domain-containing protein [Trichoderma austrokoningii]